MELLFNLRETNESICYKKKWYEIEKVCLKSFCHVKSRDGES